ncbi:MAG: phage portal protein [Magnetococcales bacterium]|nr:phage portal protein [Magnetococcales bacterium]
MGFWHRLFGGGMPSRKAGYEAAASGRRLGNWQPGNDGANALLFRDADLMRSRARDLVRRNAWAFNGVDALVSNLVGTGIKPRSTHADAAFKERVHALWLDWSREADAHGVQGFYGLQALAVRAMVEGGEVLARLRDRDPGDGLAVPLQIQLLEPEHLPFNLNRDLPNGNRIRAGIEFDRIGRRVAYHLYREHPGERAAGGGLFGDPVPVPASEVIHLFRPLRPGQIRGEPWLTQALVKLHELDQYDDAELVRKKTAALIAGFITKPSPEFALAGEDDAIPDEHGAAPVSWTPGTMQVLMPGEDVKFSEPADLGGQYGEFMKTQLRAVAVAIGVTYEQLTGDLSGVNYSSIRAGMVEFRRRMEQWQRSVIIHQFCRPVWERWMDRAVLSGALEAPGYARRRREYQAVKWIPQGWAWVDPQKEFNAVVMAIRAGLLSRDEAVATYGYDAEEIDREIAAANQRADKLGLTLDSDPRRRTRTGAAVQDSQS